jgi:ribonuclease HI
MSQDIRKYFQVTNSNTCGILFKKTNFSKTNEQPLSVKEVINIQPTPTYDSELTTFEVFTDGSTLGNGAKNALGGIGVFFPEHFAIKNVSLNYAKFVIENPEYAMNKATNNITELLAISIAIQLINSKFKKINPDKTLDSLRIILYTDSEYSINCITKWAAGWERNGWQKKTGKKTDKEIKNLELIKKLYRAYTTQRIKFVHVNSHTREPNNKNSVEWRLWYGNEMADQLAKKGATER